MKQNSGIVVVILSPIELETADGTINLQLSSGQFLLQESEKLHTPLGVPILTLKGVTVSNEQKEEMEVGVSEQQWLTWALQKKPRVRFPRWNKKEIISRLKDDDDITSHCTGECEEYVENGAGAKLPKDPDLPLCSEDPEDYELIDEPSNSELDAIKAERENQEDEKKDTAHISDTNA